MQEILNKMKKINNKLSLHSDNNPLGEEICKVNTQLNNSQKRMIVNGKVINPVEYALALKQCNEGEQFQNTFPLGTPEDMGYQPGLKKGALIPLNKKYEPESN